MAGFASNVGPLGSRTNRPWIDAGTLDRQAASRPSIVGHDNDRQLFETALTLLRAEIANLGTIAAIDGATRVKYDQLLRQFRAEILQKVSTGQLSWRQAAEEAHRVRDQVLLTVRARSTPIGRAQAERMKSASPSLNTLIGQRTIRLYGQDARFDALTAAQKERVYAAVVESAGRSNPQVNAVMRTVSRAGQGLILVSLAISCYRIATAEDKGDAVSHEVAVSGSGIAGGAIGGAIAGLACGPGSPVCVTLGVFIGGALAAFGVDFLW